MEAAGTYRAASAAGRYCLWNIYVPPDVFQKNPVYEYYIGIPVVLVCFSISVPQSGRFSDR